MKSPLISIVIPVYNVEKYISKCVNSILNQTYRNLDIILVDDGSTDSSGAICDNFASIDNWIVVIHKNNGGLSDARNCGMDVSKGKLISFIDSDDFVEETYVETLFKLMNEQNADMSVLPLYPIDENNNHIGRKVTYEKKYFNNKTAFENMFESNGLPWCAQAKLYKKEMFRGIRYPVGKLMEDKATTYKLFDKCNKIVFLDAPLYKYLVRKGSIMRSSFSKKRMGSFKIQEELNDFIKDNYPSALNLAYAYTVKVSVSMLCMMSASNFEDFDFSEKMFDYYSKYKTLFYKSKIIDKRFKIIARLISTLRSIHGQKIYRSHLYSFITRKAGYKLLTK